MPIALVLEPGRRHAAAVLSSFGWNLADVKAIPIGIGLPLCRSRHSSQLEPPTDWPGEAYRLINRLGMCQCPAVSSKTLFSSIPELNLKSESQRSKTAGGNSKDDLIEDGMEELINLPMRKMLLQCDHRIQEVRRLVSSSRPVSVVLPSSTLQGLSEHELIEEKKNKKQIF